MTNGMIPIYPLSTSITYVQSADGFYISHHTQYARACSAYDQSLNRGSLQTNMLMLQGIQQSRLQPPMCKLSGRYNDLVCQLNLSLGQMLSDVFHSCLIVLNTLILVVNGPIHLI
jgi:hypothetical protein